MQEKVLSTKELSAYFPKREKACNKGDFGKCVIFASSDEFIGAAKIALLGALAMRLGAGYACLAVTPTVAASVSKYVYECILALQAESDGCFKFDKEKVDKAIKNADSVVLGMGMNKNAETKALAEYLLHNFQGSVCIDADGLNSVSDEILSMDKQCKLIVTPHPKEFSRLTGLSVKEILDNRAELAVKYAKKWRATVLLKSERTVITDGESLYAVNETSPSLAKAGSGDFLSGAIAALNIKYPPVVSGAVAATIIAKAAKNLAEKYNDNVILARDLLPEILEFFKT